MSLLTRLAAGLASFIAFATPIAFAIPIALATPAHAAPDEARATPTHAAPDEARALVKRALDALPQIPFVATLQLTVDRGEPRELRLSHKVIGGVRSSYLEVLSPADLKGTRFLFFEHPDGNSEQFLTIPVSRKIIQVSDTVRKYSFLGSAFYVADLIEPALDAFSYTFAGQDDIAGRHCRLIESAPKKREGELYAKMLLAIDLKDSLVLKRLFLDDKAALLKVWTVERVEKIAGHWTLLDQRMKNVVDHTESRLLITDINYDVELPDATFTRQQLAR